MDAPQLQRRFVTDVLPRIQQDARVAGVAIAGSLARGNPDVYSDVDLVVVIEDSAFESVMSERFALIDAWATVVIGFTGEHVGEPRLVITLVGPPLLHVDFKFVCVSDFAERDEKPVILWDRDGSLAHTRSGPPRARAPLDLQWIEDRFWVWVHYGATKLGRGELFEVVSFLNYLREAVLAPLITHRMGAPARGVRHLEAIARALGVSRASIYRHLAATTPRHSPSNTCTRSSLIADLRPERWRLRPARTYSVLAPGSPDGPPVADHCCLGRRD